MRSAANVYELVVRVELPEGMDRDDFLARTRIEWGQGGWFDTFTLRGNYRQGADLSEVPRFIGRKELRRV